MAAGADQAEASAVVNERFNVEARGAEVTKLERSIGRNVVVRAFVGGAKASFATTDISLDALRSLATETVDAARFVEADVHAGLTLEADARASTQPGADGLQLFGEDVASRAADAKIADARELERQIRAADARIVNSSGSYVIDSIRTVSLANSLGFAGSYRATSAALGTAPIAADGTAKRPGSFGTAARSYARTLDVATVAAQAVARAVGGIGSRKPPTMRVPVIFERDAAAMVLGDIFSAVNAANVAIDNSFLATRIGDRIGSPLATIVDDGRLPAGLGSAPFDAEGIATRRTVVCDRGELRTFLYDGYYARRLGAASTGNASSGGIGPTNFYLTPGEGTLEALIARTPRGILVLEMIGFSTESVTGTYSRGARGFYIEQGELAYPVDEFTIAGNLVDMLGAIDAVAGDLVFDQSIVAPSFRVGEMTVSGI